MTYKRILKNRENKRLQSLAKNLKNLGIIFQQAPSFAAPFTARTLKS